MSAVDTIRQALQCDNPSCECHKPNGKVHCPTPGHPDIHPSFSVDQGDNGKVLVKCQSQCRDNQDLPINALKSKGLWPSSNGNGKPKFNIIEVYDYHDPAGKLVFQVCRTDNKEFPQRRPDPLNPNQLIWSTKGITLYPYRLPQVIKADTVFVEEGEKDVASIERLGFVGTTSPGGASEPGKKQKWRPDFNPYFQGKQVIILPDNDPPGKAHALNVARNLHGVAASVKVVKLPGLPEKGDISDWIKAGGTKEQLLALVEAAPEFDPATAPAPDTETTAPTPTEPEAKPAQAERLIKLAAEAELFHDMNRKGYATIPVSGHLETWPIKSMAFRDWLRGLFYKAHKKTPGGQALQDALDLLAAQARFDGEEREIYVRVAHAGGKIYVDLANESWQAVEITPQGWKVVDRPPVKFRRPRGLAPMPTPVPGGSLDDLKPFINCRDDDWPLVVGWLLGAYSPGPYPVKGLEGEQGTAKTTTSKILKALVDPGHAPQRTVPRDIRDLMISANNSWCLSFDNISNLSQWVSDGFCRLATGGGLSTRELYSDADETILDAMRPVILNGIDSLVNRGDLGRRIILLELPIIQDRSRRRERDLWRQFEATQPGILGALFTALSVALANLHKVKLPEMPSMADFATWVVAAESVLPWEPGTFLAAYNRNRAVVVEHSLEGDPVAVALRSFMEHRKTWEGTPTELLNALTETAGDLVSRGRAWPKAANALSNRLRRSATFLRASGIEYERGKSGPRLIAIRKGLQKTVQTVQTVHNENPCGFPLDDPLDDPKGLDEQTVHLDDPRTILDDPQKRPSTRKATNDKGLDDVDDVDDEIRDFSNLEVEL